MLIGNVLRHGQKVIHLATLYLAAEKGSEEVVKKEILEKRIAALERIKNEKKGEKK